MTRRRSLRRAPRKAATAPPRCRGWCKRHYKLLTGQGVSHEMKRYAAKCGSKVEDVDYEVVLATHGMVCHICGGEIESRRVLNMDHVIPLLGGHNGPHTYDNIRPAHRWCNQRKGTKLMAEIRGSLSDAPDAGPAVRGTRGGSTRPGTRMTAPAWRCPPRTDLGRQSISTRSTGTCVSGRPGGQATPTS